VLFASRAADFVCLPYDAMPRPTREADLRRGGGGVLAAVRGGVLLKSNELGWTMTMTAPAIAAIPTRPALMGGTASSH